MSVDSIPTEGTAGPAANTGPAVGSPTNPRPAAINRLTVVYDEECELCRRCRHWLSLQQTHLPVTFLAAGHPAAKQLYEPLAWYRVELMVIADDGTAWVGPAAFIMCLWATVRWRSTSYRLRSPAFAPLAESFFHGLSSNRSTISGMLSSHRCDDEACRR